MKEFNDKKIIGVYALARELGVTEKTVRNNNLHEKIPHWWIGKRRVYSKSAIELFLGKSAKWQHHYMN